MQIKIHKNFSKRINSTKRPTGGTTIDVVLKEECTIENPIFILNGYDASIDYIEAFGKYYFVDKKNIIDNSRCEYACIEDYLATGKSDIGNTTALIARSSSRYNTHLIDTMVSITNSKTSTARDAFAAPFSTTGCFVLSVVNDVSSATGFVCNYVIDAAGLADISSWLSGEASASYDVPWADIETWLMIQFGNLFDCVRALKWLPVDYATASAIGTQMGIRIGKYNTHINGYKITSTVTIDDYTTIDLSDILPADFRASSPFSSVDLFIPYYGLVALTPDECVNEIGIRYDIDVTVGDCMVVVNTVGTDKEKILASIHYNIAADCPIAQVGIIAHSVLSNTVAAVGALVTGNPLSLLSTGAGLISAMASNGASAKGSIDGRAMAHWVNFTAYVTVCGTTSPDDLLTLYGRPCMEVLKISGLSGYVQCINASVASSLTQSEIARINGMLNEGFYYE